MDVTDGPPEELLEELSKELMSLPGAQAVLLAGSAGSGELLWEADGGARKLLSDIEVALVTGNLSLRPAVRKTARRLGDRFGCDLEIFIVTPGRLRRGAPKNISFRVHRPTILMYELAAAPLLRGRMPTAAKRFDPADLPPWEGIRLILNRLGEGGGWPTAERDPRGRWAAKLATAVGDGWLLLAGRYRSGYGARLGEWRKLSPSLPLEAAAQEWIASAYGLRLGGGGRAASPGPEALRRAVRLVTIELLRRHGGDGAERSLDSLPSWAAFFRRHPAPVRHQAPFPALDGIFDSLVVLRGAVAAGMGAQRLAAAFSLRLPLFLYVYGVLAAGFLNRDPEAGRDILGLIRPGSKGAVTAAGISRFWRGACA